jgi:hypothetical protein
MARVFVWEMSCAGTSPSEVTSLLNGGVMYTHTTNSNQYESNAELPERRLWIAVLMQAVEDWRSANVRRQKEAEAFFFDRRKDFASVCASAGLDAGNLLKGLARMKSPVTIR